MKRILMAALFSLAVCAPAFAANRTATFGDQNALGEYRIKADADSSTGANLGWVTFAQDTGIYFPYTTATTNQTLLASQTGTTLVSTSSATNARYTLPTATVGMDFNVVAGSAKQLQVTPQTTDTILFSSNTAGQGLVNSTAALGDSIELFCYVANTWAVKNHDGTWTHTGASP